MAATSPAWGPRVAQALYLLGSEVIGVWLSSTVSTSLVNIQKSTFLDHWVGVDTVSVEVITEHHMGG